MTYPPRVSIGIMTRNHAAYLGEAVESVLAQELADWEMVIADDASTDGTSEIAAGYARRDGRVRHVRHDPNLGQAGNWSFLLGAGGAPYVAVLHGDDSWTPGALGRAVAALDSGPDVDMVYGNWWRKLPGRDAVLVEQNRAHALTGADELRLQARRFQSHVSATFLTRAVVERAGRPDPRLQMLVDYEYLLRVMLRSRRTVSLAEPLAVYRSHDENATSQGVADGLLRREKKQLADLVAEYLTDAALPGGGDCVARLRRNMAGHLFSEGVSAAARGDAAVGRRLMEEGIAACPAMRREPKVMIDRLLCRGGAGGRGVFRLIHGRRLSA